MSHSPKTAHRTVPLDPETTANADFALKALADYQGQIEEIDEATNQRLLRKIDWNLMPVQIESDEIYPLSDKLALKFAWNRSCV
jgi:hypothetical protein